MTKKSQYRKERDAEGYSLRGAFPKPHVAPPDDVPNRPRAITLAVSGVFKQWMSEAAREKRRAARAIFTSTTGKES